jgi:hypothetical protein
LFGVDGQNGESYNFESKGPKGGVMNKIEFRKIGNSIYLFQPGSGDARGNRYLGPLGSPRDLEILGHRAIIKAKRWEAAAEGEKQDDE